MKWDPHSRSKTADGIVTPDGDNLSNRDLLSLSIPMVCGIVFCGESFDRSPFSPCHFYHKAFHFCFSSFGVAALDWQYHDLRVTHQKGILMSGQHSRKLFDTSPPLLGYPHRVKS